MSLRRSTNHSPFLHSWGKDGDPPVLLLHGFTGHGGSWDEAGKRFAEEGYHVLAPDLPGHGRSPHPSESTFYELAHAATGLKSLLDESVAAGVHLLGYSMGGRLALFFVLNYPERVRTLTLVGASPGIASAAERVERRNKDSELADRIERDGIDAFVEYWEALPLWNSQRRNLSTAQREQLREQRLRNRPSGLANSLRGMGTGSQPDLHDTLPSLSAPTLLLVGEEDEKFVAINRQMAHSIPKARLVVLPDTGHAVHLERPREFERTVLSFWRSAVNSHTQEPHAQQEAGSLVLSRRARLRVPAGRGYNCCTSRAELQFFQCLAHRDGWYMDRRRLGVQFLWSLLLALLVYIGLIVYGDWRELSALLADFPWRWLPPTLGLTLVNFGVRLLKWHWYLRLIRTPISFGQSARIYGISFLMMMTPGKVGEFVRAFMVRNVCGAPFAVVAPVVLAERMTDGLAMILLAGLGLLAIDEGTIRLAAATALLAIAGIIVAIQVRPLALWCLALGHRLPLVNRFADKLAAFYESSYFLLQPKYLFPSVVIGVVSWASQGLGFYLVLLGFGVEAGVSSMFTAISAFNMSTVVGAVVATPGGLGGVESSLAALSIQLLDLSRPVAAAAALVIRFATLWFGVAIGLICLALWPHLLTVQKGTVVEEPEARA